MPTDSRQIASADDLAERYGADATVIARALAVDHAELEMRTYWSGVLRLLHERGEPAPFANAHQR